MARDLPPPPAECANCGAAIPRAARSCPECGADEGTGWRETDGPDYAQLDLPDSADDERLPRSSPRRSGRHVNGLAWYWWCAGVALLLLLGLAALGLR